MKKRFLLSLLVLLCINVMSQEKGSYITISAGLGPTGYKYNIQGVNEFAKPKDELKLGGQVGIGYSYYFTKNFGISTGLGLSHYRTYGKLLGEFQDFITKVESEIKFNSYELGTYIDKDPIGTATRYKLRVRTQNWMEYQSGKYLEIPLLFNLQKKFGKNEYFGIYLGVGAKFQIPISTTYSIIDEDTKKELQAGINVYGFYTEDNLPLGRYDDENMPLVSAHGFGVNYAPSKTLSDAHGKLNFKFNVALVAEAGFLISLSRRVDIPVGAFVDYGLLNLKRKNENKDMFTYQGGENREYTSDAKGIVGKNIGYNSITATNAVNKVKTLSYGGKIGIRVKLGKLSKREEPEPLMYAPVAPNKGDRDTVFLYVYNRDQIDSLVNEFFDAIKDRTESAETNAVDPTKPFEKDTYVQKYNYNDNPVEYDYYYDDKEFTENEIFILLEPIYFDLNKDVLKPESKTSLDKKIEVMTKHPDIKLVIFGNTCDIGKDSYNYILGERRAEAARKYLISKGIVSNRLIIRTLSRFEPEMPNTSEFNRTHNRRDDFRPLFPKKRMMMW